MKIFTLPFIITGHLLHKLSKPLCQMEKSHFITSLCSPASQVRSVPGAGGKWSGCSQAAPPPGQQQPGDSGENS